VDSDERFEPHYRELLEVLLDSGDDDIVDFGCGHGRHVSKMIAGGKLAVGVDHCPPEAGVTHAAESGYGIIEGSWDDLGPGSYGAGWSHHVLEHSRDAIGTLHAWGHAIRTGGRLYVAVPRFRADVLAGHVHTGFSAHQLAYLLALAGWDCRDGAFAENSLNAMAVVVKPAEFTIKDHLKQGTGEGSGWSEAQLYLPGEPTGGQWVLPQRGA